MRGVQKNTIPYYYQAWMRGYRIVRFHTTTKPGWGEGVQDYTDPYHYQARLRGVQDNTASYYYQAWMRWYRILGPFACSGFSRPKSISVAKSAKLRESVTEKRDPKKHLSLSVASCNQKHANRIPQPKVGICLVVRKMSRLPLRGSITMLR